MYFNDREKRRLLKVKTKLGDMWEGNLRRYHVTPHTAREIANCYNALVKAPETLSRETISYDVKNKRSPRSHPFRSEMTGRDESAGFI